MARISSIESETGGGVSCTGATSVAVDVGTEVGESVGAIVGMAVWVGSSRTGVIVTSGKAAVGDGWAGVVIQGDTPQAARPIINISKAIKERMGENCTMAMGACE